MGRASAAGSPGGSRHQVFDRQMLDLSEDRITLISHEKSRVESGLTFAAGPGGTRALVIPGSHRQPELRVAPFPKVEAWRKPAGIGDARNSFQTR
jgi:hypothetical protein